MSLVNTWMGECLRYTELAAEDVITTCYALLQFMLYEHTRGSKSAP